MQRARTRPGARGSRRGASAVEFALVVTFVFLPLVFGLIFFGFLFAQNLALGNSARQGARLGVVDATTCGSIVGSVQDSSTTVGLRNPAAVSVEIQKRSTSGTLSTVCAATTNRSSTVVPCKASSSGEGLYVKATFSSTMKLPLMPSSISANGSGEFRCEFS